MGGVWSQIWVAVITAIIAPVILFLLQEWRNRKDKRLDTLEKKIEETWMGTIRLQILYLIFHDPKNKVAINQLMDFYTKNGGNSYVQEVYQKWKKAHK